MVDEYQRSRREEKGIVALAFRNGPIEDLYAGVRCPACADASGYSKISDEEMKVLMKSAVNRVYELLRLKATNQENYAAQITYGARCAASWDEPEHGKAGFGMDVGS